MADKVTHYFPDAMVIFVRGFSNTSPKDLDYTIASNLGEVKEVSSINIDLTVKNSPGTFNLTIVDTANKFIIPDDPEKEIPSLFKSSNRKISSDIRKEAEVQKIIEQSKITTKSLVQTATTQISGGFSAGGNYYEFNTYQDWLNFEHGVLEEGDEGSKLRYPIYYVRNKASKIFERFAFDQLGNVIKVVPKDSTNDEEFYNNIVSGDTFFFDVLGTNGETFKNSYKVWKFKNSDFIDSYKDTTEQGVNTFAKGRCKISPMDRVVIYMSERFGSGEQVDTTTKRKMTRVFTGVVNTVQQGYSSNQNTITVQGEDVTKYLRLSVININPSLPLDSVLQVDRAPTDQISIWKDLFTGMDAPTIVRVMCLGGGPEKKEEFFRNKVTGVGLYRLSDTTSEGNLVYDPNTDTFGWGGKAFEGQNEKDHFIDFTTALGKLFQKSTVHIINPFLKGFDLEGFRAYELAVKDNFSFYQSDFKTRREIAYQIAEETNFCFYANRFGEIWFHSPRFSNAHILGAPNPKVYIIDTESIISYGFIEDDSQVYSSVYVSTTPAFGLTETEQLGVYQASFRDDNTTIKYGQRLFSVSNPLLNAGANKSYDKVRVTLQLYAKGLLQKLLAGKYQGQVTIVGRAELDPGYPVYIPIRNMIYYVESLSHSFSFGDQFTTTLNLSYGHKPWEFVPEVLTFAANDEVCQTGGQIIDTFLTKAERDAKNAKKVNDNFVGSAGGGALGIPK